MVYVYENETYRWYVYKDNIPTVCLSRAYSERECGKNGVELNLNGDFFKKMYNLSGLGLPKVWSAIPFGLHIVQDVSKNSKKIRKMQVLYLNWSASRLQPDRSPMFVYIFCRFFDFRLRFRELLIHFIEKNLIWVKLQPQP